MENSPFLLDQKKIQEFLPHRYPFLLVDRILDISGPHTLDDDDLKHKIGVKVVGIKNVSVNEPFFQGHFPGLPIMPGVLLIEAMAQVASFSVYPSMMKKIKNHETLQTILVGVDGARFRAPVIPGDQLRIEAVCIACRKSLWSFECKVFVEGKLVAEAKLLANIIATSEKKVF